MLNAIMLSVVMLSVFMLSVMAPARSPYYKKIMAVSIKYSKRLAC